MILPFQKRFVAPILEGTKIHTIREDKHDRWHPGRKIHAATGVRTKNYNCFFEDECVSTQEIYISYQHGNILQITVGDRYLYWEDQLKLAINDGFENYEDFFNWFYAALMKLEYQFFAGKIIHWTDFQYE